MNHGSQGNDLWERNQVRGYTSNGVVSYLCQLDRYCGGRGGDSGGEGVPWGVSNMCEGLQSAPRLGGLRQPRMFYDRLDR